MAVEVFGGSLCGGSVGGGGGGCGLKVERPRGTQWVYATV